MLVVQHNCGQGYESKVLALEMALSIGAGIVMLQELFIGTREINHIAFNLYWSQAKRKEIKVMMTVQKKLTDKIVVEYRTDLINHPYIMLLEIRELDPRSKKPARKTHIVNVYDNQVGRGCTWDGGISHTRRVLEDIEWGPVIRGRVLIARDINNHSQVWNLHCHRRQNAAILEEHIDKFSLLINNEPECAICPSSQTISVIDLALSTVDLDPLTLWEIPEECPVLSDHELIVLCWEDIDQNVTKFSTSRITG